MQTALATRTRAAAPSPRAKAISGKNAAPPVIVTAKVEPHPVYGTTPIGRGECTLEVQNIHTLDQWHERAARAEDERFKALRKVGKDADDDPRYNLLYNCKWAVFEAAFKIKINWPSEVAKLSLMIARQVADSGDVGILTLERLQHVATISERVTQPSRAAKHVGALQRGRLLTRAGLLHRYQAFLIQELETLSWNLYGSRDYAMQYRPNDHAVSKRCNGTSKHPFFDESKLPARARSVLKSLRIDTARNDDVPVRKSSKRGSR
jgi:hypothetical protein